MSSEPRLQEISARDAIKVPLASPASFPGGHGIDAGVVIQRGSPIFPTPPASCATLAPISGTLGAISTVRLTTGLETSAMTIEPLTESETDATPSSTDDLPPVAKPISQFQPTDLTRITDELRLAGVTADRWTSPDLLGQLHQCVKRPVDTIVCTVMDYDDSLPLQQTVACQFATEIVAAIGALAAITAARRALVVVGTSSNEGCRRALERAERGTSVKTVMQRSAYPQSNPTLMLHALLGRKLRPGSLPTEAGVVVVDAIAAMAIGQCLLYGRPLLRTPIGIADMRATASGQTHLLSVPIGTSLGSTLRAVGISSGGFELRGGSPLREVRLDSNCVMSGDGEGAIYLVTPQPVLNASPCIRCGWCVSSCPVHIQPAGLLQAAQTGDPVDAERFGLDACIECGVCSYVCPSHLPLLQGIRVLRSTTPHSR